ncbi:MAG: hypothetical protein PVI23_00805 [Maricaulaceae bacterium]|jgi:hypothetical protein
MIKLHHAALLGAFALAACGGASAEVATLTDACLEDNSLTASECSCMANLAEQELTEDQLGFLVAMVGSDDPTSAFAEAGAPNPADLAAVMQFAQTAEAQCAES